MTIKLNYLNGPAMKPLSGGPAKQLVVFLHGLGADGHDLIGLANHIAKVLPDAAFIAPNAPDQCDMAPVGHQWFSLQDRSYAQMLAGVEAAAPKLNGFLDEVLSIMGLDDDQLYIIGFSQGTMMALYTMPRRAKACGGIIGFSGALIGGDELQQITISKPPVLLIHGDVDDVIPFDALAYANDGLKSAGIAVQTVARHQVGHTIDQEGLAATLRFLHECHHSKAEL
jgi:phospholipase/carboxylesterase